MEKLKSINETAMTTLEKLQQMPDATKVLELCQKHYAVQYEDGSMSFHDADGKSIKTPMSGYDVIRNFTYLGDYHDVPHFAFKGTNFATRMHSETCIFDINGHEKLFRDPRLYAQESVFEIQKTFDRLKEQGWDFLQDIGERQSRGMRR